MIFILTVLVLVLETPQQILSIKTCDDCQVFTLCEEAKRLVYQYKDSRTATMFNNALCGYENIEQMNVPKVCCSDFKFSTRSGIDSEDSKIDYKQLKYLPPVCGDISGWKIFGGTAASLYEFPWMALISFEDGDTKGFLCGGSIINSRYILTAAHCVDKGKVLGVRVGEYDTNDPKDCLGEPGREECVTHTDVEIDTIIIHEGWISHNIDIALIRLLTPLDLKKKNIQAICLPLSKELRNMDISGVTAKVAGWGITETGQNSSKLLKVDLSIRSHEECRYYNRRADEARIDKEFCAGGNRKDTCRGDSGGPLMIEGRYGGANRYIQYGITSRGSKICGDPNPAVYTDVTKYVDWILEKISKDSEESPDLLKENESKSVNSSSTQTDKLSLLPESCGDVAGNRIVGGTVANLYEFPWMALISFKTRRGPQFKCGGSIINSRYILTAAHCVKGKDIAGIRLGEYDIRYDTDCQGEDDNLVCESHLQDVAVQEKIVHEDYQTSPVVKNDIALLRLEDEIDFGFKNVGPICLPVSSALRNKSLTGEHAAVTGWGLTEEGTASSVLLKVIVPIKSEDTCRDYYNEERATSQVGIVNQFCAGEVNRDSCNGDSGGPLMLEENYNGVDRFVQYGIVSFGPKQCGSDVPGIYTDVRKYVDWILANIKA